MTEARFHPSDLAGRDPLAGVYDTLEPDVKAFVDRQHRDAYGLIEAVRSPVTGLYSDAYDTAARGPVRMASIAATGVGLVSLAVAHVEGWDPHAGEKAVVTLRSALGGAAPREPGTGFFYHFHDLESGAVWGESEVSTIDTAILVAGARLAAAHLGAEHPEVAHLYGELLHSIRWDMTVSDVQSGELFMTIEEGRGARPIRPFNEYAIVAALARRALPLDATISVLWDDVFAPHRTPLMPTREYRGARLLVDSPNAFLSSFVCQFPLYLIPEYAASPAYRELVRGACLADRLSWQAAGETPDYVWGHGAGSNAGFPEQDKGGYQVDAIGRSSGVASGYIVAGFLPVYPQGIYDLYALYRLHLPYDSPSFGEGPDGERLRDAYRFGIGRFSWSHRRPPSRWHPAQVTVIDWSSMLYGLTALKRGLSFFTAEHRTGGDAAGDGRAIFQT